MSDLQRIVRLPGAVPRCSASCSTSSSACRASCSRWPAARTCRAASPTSPAAPRAAEHRRFPRAIAVAGLVACLGLAFFVEVRVWLAGAALIAVGLAYQWLARRIRM